MLRVAETMCAGSLRRSWNERTRLRTKVKVAPALSFPPVRGTLLQRKCVCGGTPGPTGECEGCRKKRLQRKIGNPESEIRNDCSVPPIVHEVLRSPGRPLDATTRAFMEPRFGHDFSNVRVHTDADAAESARAVNALAYTVGRNIVFGAGQYAAGTNAGQRLLAHELTHAIQQDNAGSFDDHLAVGSVTNRHESEAERIAQLVTQSGKPVSQGVTPTRVALQRECVDGHWKTVYDGCSLPWYGGLLLGIRHGNDPASGFRRPGNPTGERKDTRFAIPESRTGPCDKHDACYQTCVPKEKKNDAKKICDHQFHENMLEVCKSADQKEQRRCKRAANQYYQGLQNFVADGVFARDQKKSCACKPN
jgi:uncharacterized protein DUF4157